MSMQSLMANDLREVINRDMPAECKIGAQTLVVAIDDLLGEEIEGYGGPESIAVQRITFHAADKPSIEIGSKLATRQKPENDKPVPKWESKIVMSFILSADGNALIATVRGD